MLVIAQTLDRMLETDRQEDMINSSAVESLCRRVYAIFKAFERVNTRTDWERPKNQTGKAWKTKVDWYLADQYYTIEDDDVGFQDADQEVIDKLQKKALIAKHRPSSNRVSTVDGARALWRRSQAQVRSLLVLVVAESACRGQAPGGA